MSTEEYAKFVEMTTVRQASGQAPRFQVLQGLQHLEEHLPFACLSSTPVRRPIAAHWLGLSGT